jgi:hypothetical protein
MKALTRAGIVFSLLLAGATANAGWSGNIGWQSDYYFRGIVQKSSSAQGGRGRPLFNAPRGMHT